ncbi:MAG: hypothetical protein J6U54_06040 [Clostridiales bacterium]|nr:hypothetical protein [Clostridiales bacterium]
MENEDLIQKEKAQKLKKMKTAAKKEAKRLKELLLNEKVSQQQIMLIEPIIENTAWMKIKLDETRESIKTSSVAMPYNNGGGQKGVRENPLFKGYEALWKAYMQGMEKILDQLPEEAAKTKAQEIEKPKTMLELVRERHGA